MTGTHTIVCGLDPIPTGLFSCRCCQWFWVGQPKGQNPKKVKGKEGLGHLYGQDK